MCPRPQWTFGSMYEVGLFQPFPSASSLADLAGHPPWQASDNSRCLCVAPRPWRRLTNRHFPIRISNDDAVVGGERNTSAEPSRPESKRTVRINRWES